MRSLRATLLLVCIAALLAAPGCDGRPRSGTPGEDPTLLNHSDPHVGELDLRRGVPEQSDSGLFADAAPRSFAHLVLQLRELAEAENLKGVFVRLGTAQFGMSRANEIGRLLGKLRDKELPVVCHANNYGNASMLLAARGCDELWVSLAGGVDTVGIAGQMIFGRALLEKLDVRVDFLQVGKYKGAAEPFTRDEASPEARDSLKATLVALREAWRKGIAEGRGSDADLLGIEDGPHTAQQAEQRGLIDEIGFEHEARAAVLTRAAVDGHVVYFGRQGSESDGVTELVRVLSGTSAATSPHVAVVRATGAISMQPSGSLFGGGGGINERDLGKTLRQLRRNDDVVAIVLRIDSPGGSALASDLLWDEIMRLRADKPVVVSVGAMAASGGYYLASAATKIVAEPTSILGSIGVVTGKLSFADSLANIGVNVETVPAGPGDGSRALYFSALSNWDDATKTKILYSVEAVYRLFLERIAEGRNSEVGKIEPYAEGRIYGGVPALAGGMIDELGGLDRAIELAKDLAELDSDAPIAIVQLAGGLLALLGAEDADARAHATEQQLRRGRHALARDVIELVPFRHEIDTFVGSARPLLQGERNLVALPFALAVR